MDDAGDENGQNRHQHLKVVADTFSLPDRCGQEWAMNSENI